jgi:allantoicase
MTQIAGLPSKPSPEAEALALRYVDLAHPRLGSEVVYATDDFFADKARMIDPAPPVFYPDLYDDNGKWMDGWESRRKRGPGHDHAILRLGRPGLPSTPASATRRFRTQRPSGRKSSTRPLLPAMPTT